MNLGQQKPLLIGVTGAQGVGKSTFCKNLLVSLRASTESVELLEGLGARVAAMGFPLGSASTPASILAVFAAHLERESTASKGLVLLDRCVVDALAYTRALGISSEVERRVLEQVCVLSAERLSLVVHLELSSFFQTTSAAHESAELRDRVSTHIPLILTELRVRSVDVDAARPGSVDLVSKLILGDLIGG